VLQTAAPADVKDTALPFTSFSATQLVPLSGLVWRATVAPPNVPTTTPIFLAELLVLDAGRVFVGRDGSEQDCGSHPGPQFEIDFKPETRA
jgi:hypothetical protein